LFWGIVETREQSPESGDTTDRVVRVDPVALTRSLVDIDSTTGREAGVGAWLSAYLTALGWHVVEQPVVDGRFNVFATAGASPRVVFSTHLDCVPPFFPSREADGMIFGRGSCDAKGILAAQVAAADRLREAGEDRVGLLYVVGEERGSEGAKTANELAPPSVAFLVNGEPTDSRLGIATRGALRVRLSATGRAAHSSFPELGESAIDKLLDALIRGVELPSDPVLGRTHYSVGLIEGGVAPNVVSPHASAELMFRTVGESAAVLNAIDVASTLVSIEQVLEIPLAPLHTESGFDAAVFPYTTDIPFLSRWGKPLLLGPGSIHVAHTDEEHISVDELRAAVDLYQALARRLLALLH
jgi:acetylornithine deacetylase